MGAHAAIGRKVGAEPPPIVKTKTDSFFEKQNQYIIMTYNDNESISMNDFLSRLPFRLFSGPFMLRLSHLFAISKISDVVHNARVVHTLKTE